MAVTKQQYDRIFSIARANPGTIVDKQLSNKFEVVLVHRKRNKRWSVDKSGKMRRIVNAA